MFRRVYWVVEHIYADGRSQVHGVYTSIPNLIRHGLKVPDGVAMRLTLTKLDGDDEPFGIWMEPQFEEMIRQLDKFVKTEEFSAEQCHSLAEALLIVAKAA